MPTFVKRVRVEGRVYPGGIRYWLDDNLLLDTSTGGAPITGTIAAGQVAVGSGVNTIAGDAGLTYDAAANTLAVDNVQFDLTPTPTSPSEGLMYWNADDGTLNLGMPGGNVNLQLGQEMLVRARNTTGAPIPNGTVVYISGESGGKPLISLADPDSVTTASAIGMTTEAINHNSNGYVCTRGYVRDVNTSAYAPGTVLWLSDNGTWSSTKPTAPRFSVVVGVVVIQGTGNGVIYANIDIIPRLDSLSNVYISGLAGGDLIRWDAGDGRWENVPPATAAGAASESAAGVAELATTAEVQAGTDTTRIVTPAGLRADVPATPAASRGVRLDSNGDLLLPSGGDVLPDGATDVDHGIDKRLRDVSGPVAVGDYGYNASQLFAPRVWWAGTSAPADDFLADNYGGIWSAVSGCTQYQYANYSSWLYLRSGANADTNNNHAVWQATIPSHTTNDYYWVRMIPGDLTAQDSRIGMVILQSDLKAGVGLWYKWISSGSYAQLEVATYNSADAWLSQTNAKTSAVAFTTDWTSRWTGTQLAPDELDIQTVAARVLASTVGIYINRGTVGMKTLVSTITMTLTPAYLFLFSQGNLTGRKVAWIDWAGQNIIT